MRPMTMLNGILLGTAVAIAIGTAVTLLIVSLLAGESQRLQGEWRPLLVTTVLFTVLSGVCAAAFVGHLRERTWRWVAQLGVLFSLVAIVAFFWPRGG
jgi:O-antigen ligase